MAVRGVQGQENLAIGRQMPAVGGFARSAPPAGFGSGAGPAVAAPHAGPRLAGEKVPGDRLADHVGPRLQGEKVPGEKAPSEQAQLPVSGGGYALRFDPSLTQVFLEVRDPTTARVWVQFPDEKNVRQAREAIASRVAAGFGRSANKDGQLLAVA